VLAASAGASLILAEAGCRLFLNAQDYLSVEMIIDPVLGAVPKVDSGRFDAWGFRNPQVPERAEIVAIGDSHTYGNTATMNDSWPYVLSRLTGKSVYNMGLGGYGPNQYLHLLKTRALGLRPRIVLCGLYMGDDFENAFLITYGLSHWSYLRELPARDVDFNIWKNEMPALSWHKKIRVWLSRHSVAYQLVFHGPLMGHIQGEYQIRNAARLYGSATTLSVPEKGILEAFLPRGMLARLDQGQPAVREGMRITFALLNEMNSICRRHNIQFEVVVIPTKEMVFSEYLERDSGLPLHDVIVKLLANERIARGKMFQFLDSSGIAYHDTLPGLRSALGKQLYARTAADMHPSGNGYRVIAESIKSNLLSVLGSASRL
jgi:hypothetical protein